MVRKWLPLIVFALLAGCESIVSEDPIQFLEYGCDDLVVVGRIKTLGSEPFQDPESVLGSSVWDMQIRVKQVVRGTERRATIPVSGLAHAQIRDDIDFLIVLAKPEGGRSYSIRWANLASYTRPATTCTDLLVDS